MGAAQESEAQQFVPSYGLVEGGDPWARKSTRVSTEYPGWAQEEMETLKDQGKRLSHWDYAQSDGDGDKNDVERGHWRDQRKVEVVIVADEGRYSTTRTPGMDYLHPYDPRNNPPNKPVHDPATYTFVRDRTDVYYPEPLNGYKTTLADNIRPQSTMGMRPQYRRGMRNTYRIEPEPWDSDIVDLPDQPVQSKPGIPGQGYSSGSTYRLG